MNRFASPTNFTTRLRNPLLREHFVYRAYDADGALLYIGCTMDFAGRMASHRSNGDWAHLAVRFRLAGPFNYETARHLEREAIQTERSQFNSMTPERTAVAAAHQRVLKRRQAALMGEGVEFLAAYEEARDYADWLVPSPKGRERFRCDDLTVPTALRADREDAARYDVGAA